MYRSIPLKKVDIYTRSFLTVNSSIENGSFVNSLYLFLIQLRNAFFSMSKVDLVLFTKCIVLVASTCHARIILSTCNSTLFHAMLCPLFI